MSFLKRLYRKLKTAYDRSKKVSVRTIYSLPALSRYDPRHKLTTFKNYCVNIENISQVEKLVFKDWYFPVYPCETIQRKQPITVDENEIIKFKESVGFYQYGFNEFKIPEVFLSCINKGKIYGRDFVVVSNDNYIFFDSALSYYPILEGTGILDTIIRPKLRCIAGPYFVLGMHWYNEYYHWILEILPRLSLIEQFQELQTIPLIIPNNLGAIQRESLQMVGISPERTLEFDNGYWQVEKLYFANLLSMTGNPSPRAVAWLRSRFLKDLNPETFSSKGHYYITRRDASRRLILNEDKIIAYLEDKGFEVICPGELSFTDQIKVFSNANIVVAPHGAGLTNMVFAPENATLVELFPDDYINGCYWALANVCGHNYAFICGHSEGADAGFYISLDRLKTLLAALSMLSTDISKL